MPATTPGQSGNPTVPPWAFRSPFLEALSDPIPYLQVFAQRYRDGRLSKSTLSVRSCTVEQALRDIGQTPASLGAPDPSTSA
jgi:hypothetical protein